MSALSPGCVVAVPEHVQGLIALLIDPSVSGPIYDLPCPIDTHSIAQWIEDAEAGRQAGEALLVVTPDANGEIFTYSRFTIWPKRASAEIAGSFRADAQSAGMGKALRAASCGCSANPTCI